MIFLTYDSTFSENLTKQKELHDAISREVSKIGELEARKVREQAWKIYQSGINPTTSSGVAQSLVTQGFRNVEKLVQNDFPNSAAADFFLGAVSNYFYSPKNLKGEVKEILEGKAISELSEEETW